MRNWWINIRQWYRRRNDPECALAIDEKIWRAILLTACIASIAWVAYGWWALSQAYTEGMDRGAAASPKTLEREQVNEMLKVFEQRSVQFEHQLANPPAISGPAQ